MSLSSSILVVRLSAIGDLVLVAPVVAQLHHEGYKVSLLCKDAYRSVVVFARRGGDIFLGEG